MTVDPHIDYSSHDHGDDEELSENPAIREAQLLERRMRRALATKDDPMHDNERTVERLRRAERAELAEPEPEG